MGCGSTDVRGTYAGRVIPRKLPGPDNTAVAAKPAYDAAMKTARPALQALYRDIFANNKLDAIAFPTTPKVALPAQPDASSLATFILFTLNPDPRTNAAIPGVQITSALGATFRRPT